MFLQKYEFLVKITNRMMIVYYYGANWQNKNNQRPNQYTFLNIEINYEIQLFSIKKASC